MRLGLIEFLLVLAIFLLVFGPAVIGWVNRWMRRARKTNQELARRRAAAQAQMRAERDAVLRRFQIVGLGMAALMVLSLSYALLLRPIDPAPRSYQAPAAVSPAQGQTLSGRTAVELEGYSGLSCIRLREGWVYFSARDEEGGSAILRLREDGSSLTRILTSEGEITGFDFGPEGEIWFTVLTGQGGMLCRGSYDGWGASTQQVVTQMDGQPLPCPTAVAVTPEGVVYFASLSAHPAEEGLDQAVRTELLAHTATGQVYAYDPAARTVEPVLGGLAGASGLVYDPDANYLYVSELGSRCIWVLEADARERTAGGRGTALFAQGLPGYPSALSLGEEGQIWVGYRYAPSSWLESQAAETFQRGVALRLPAGMQAGIFSLGADSPAAQLYDAQGQLLASVSSEEGGGVSALCPSGSRLYLGGCEEAPALGWLLC